MHFVKCNKKKRNINHNVTNRILRNRHLLCGDIEYIYIYVCEFFYRHSNNKNFTV